jgi:hypothetical protein
MMLSIQKSPTAKQIQPIGLWGRLEAIRAPTKGKARKGTMKTNTMLKLPVPQVIGGCADRGSMMYNATFATNMISERVESDQASHAAVRALIPPIPRLCSLAPSVTPPLYSTSVSQTLRSSFSAGVSRLPKIQLSKKQTMYACFLESERGFLEGVCG